MRKHLLFPALALCLVLLVGTFLIVPKPTLAKASYTPISVTQPGQCAQIVSLFNTQSCVMFVSLTHDAPQPIHVTVSTTVMSCFQGTCRKSTPANTYVQTVLTSGNTLQYASSPIPILIIEPLDLEGGHLTFTFVVSGPSNSVTRQLSTTSED